MSGSNQSPIDIASVVEADQDDLAIRYGRSTVHGRDVGNTLEFSIAGGSSVTHGGTRYDLEQFHIHTPAEHAIGGELAAGEVHFVNRGSDGSLLVVAVFVEASELSRGPRDAGQAVPLGILLPEERSHYAYNGSLTTAPFTEGVQWIILTERVPLRPEWIESFSDRFGPNNRSLQALNDRVITLH